MFASLLVNKRAQPATCATRLVPASSTLVRLARWRLNALPEFARVANVAVLLVVLAPLATPRALAFRRARQRLVAFRQWAIALAPSVARTCWRASQRTIACSTAAIRFDCVDRPKLAQNPIFARRLMRTRSVRLIRTPSQSRSPPAATLAAKMHHNVFRWLW